MEIRKRKLHHTIVKSRALLNKKVYRPTGQSPRLQYGDKPARYDQPILNPRELIYGRKETETESECSMLEE